MTSPTPRWTAETEELVARTVYAAYRWDSSPPTLDALPAKDHDYYRNGACAVLTALADAGVLTAVGGETRQEWGVLHETFGIDGPVVARTEFEEDNEALARRMSAGSPASLKLVRRSVHIEPWREVTDDPA